MLSIVQETFKPLGDLVLLRPIDPSKTTKGGLLMPDTVKPRQPRAEVVAVGPGRMLESGKRHELLIKPGDIVTLTGGVHSVELEGHPEKLILCEYAQIAGIIS